MRVAAIDWSGAKKGERKKIWTCEVDVGSRSIVRLESGLTREQAIEAVIERRGDGNVVVGLDFAFGFPLQFMQHHGWTSAVEAWDACHRHGESWLMDCPQPFWGRRGSRRQTAFEELRQTEIAITSDGPSKPKSVFQVNGGGAVGTGSIRGMPMLRRLRDAGFAIWPFEPAQMPLVVEIYPRALTGQVNKSRFDHRTKFLTDRYPWVPHVVADLGAASEDAFDALVSALVMAERHKSFANLPVIRGPGAMEGVIWVPT